MEKSVEEKKKKSSVCNTIPEYTQVWKNDDSAWAVVQSSYFKVIHDSYTGMRGMRN